MRVVIALSCLLGATSLAASSDDFKTSWSVAFQQDVFDQKLLAVGYVSQETGDTISFDKSQLQIVCGIDGKLVAAFSAGGISFRAAHDVAFRMDDGSTKTIAFKSMKAAGGRTVSGADASTELLAMFHIAKHPIAFKTEDKQGVLPVVGFENVIAAVTATCKP